MHCMYLAETIKWTNKCLMIFYSTALWTILTFRYHHCTYIHTLNKSEYVCLFVFIATDLYISPIMYMIQGFLRGHQYISPSAVKCSIMIWLKYSIWVFWLRFKLIFLSFTMFAVSMRWGKWDRQDADGSQFFWRLLSASAIIILVERKVCGDFKTILFYSIPLRAFLWHIWPDARKWGNSQWKEKLKRNVMSCDVMSDEKLKPGSITFLRTVSLGSFYICTPVSSSYRPWTIRLKF